MLNDIRHGIRVLMHAKGWTAVVLVSLAVGIGASTAIFSAVNGVMLRKLRVHDPDGLVRLRWYGSNEMEIGGREYDSSTPMPGGERVRTTFSYPMFQEFRAANQTMVDLFACAPARIANVVADGRAETASLFLATGNYYTVLGARARLGRLLISDDDRESAPPVAVISDQYWKARFAADTNIVGKVIRVNDVPVTIVGVTHPDFAGVQRAAYINASNISIPLALDSRINTTEGDRLSKPTTWWLQVVGRLKPGVTPAQVKGNIEGVFRHQARAGFDAHLASLDENQRKHYEAQGRTAVPRLHVDSASRGIYDVNEDERVSLAILGAIVALVLLMVCANVASLLLSRAALRQRELSVRHSMGATRARLIRQLLTESLLLASIGGLLGFVVAYWSRQLLPTRATSLDWRVLGFTIAATVLTGVVFGIVPAMRATQEAIDTQLKQNSRSVAGNNTLLSKALLVAQISVSLVLLIAAGLFLRTLDNLRQVDVGFDPRNLLVVSLDTDLVRYDDERAFRYLDQSSDLLRRVAGVQSVTLADPPLLSGNESGTGFFIEGRTYSAGPPSGSNDINRVVAAPNFFETMGIRLAAGRAFGDRDDKSGPRVAILNEAAARKHFPSENPVGRRIGTSPDNAGELEIVGVVRDTKYSSLREPAPPTLFIPHRQRGPSGLSIVIRTAGDPSGATVPVRDALRRADANVPVLRIETQTGQIDAHVEQEKMFAQASTLFGGVSSFLAALGLFGLLSHTVVRRTREIGIRMAMGAQREEVLALVMRESTVLVTIGIAIGIAAATGASRLVTSQLFGLEPTDPTTMTGAIALMVVISAVAGYLPARRATRVDPMVALRYE